MLLCCCFPPADPPHGLELSCDPRRPLVLCPPPFCFSPSRPPQCTEQKRWVGKAAGGWMCLYIYKYIEIYTQLGDVWDWLRNRELGEGK